MDGKIVKAGKVHIFTRFLKVSKVMIGQLNAFQKFMKRNAEEKEYSDIPKQFVDDLINLGPTFVKLGQVLSTRPDYLPGEYINELKVLHDQVPPFSFDEVKIVIKDEFNKDIEQVFRAFEVKPVAAASLSHVHFAILKDGSKAAVKIQRPLIKELISKDLIVLSWMAKILNIFYPRLTRNLNLKGAFEEFKNYTIKELDFSLEGRTLEKFGQNFRDWDDVKFPKVYWDYTTGRVLTMERVSGLHLNEVKSKMSQENRLKLSKRVTEMGMKMFISDAFFHADLHPGNIFFREDGSMAVIDVGMFGKLTNEQRDRFLLYWLAIVEKEKRRAFSHLCKLGEQTRDADREGFYAKFAEILQKFYESSISDRSLTKTYLEIFIAGAQYGFRFPSEMLLQAKALTTAEALSMTLTPDFKFYEEARPVVTRELGKRTGMEEVRRRFKQAFPEWLIFGEGIDRDIVISEDEKDKSERGWEEIGKSLAEDLDNRRQKQKEILHGEYAVVINESLEKVYNFVTRFAQYPGWHPTYTELSRVIHVSGKYVFITPEVKGSVFRLDEIVDGNQLLSNAVVTEIERNKLFKWRAPLSILPLVDIGTCFTFEDLGSGQTRLYEYFYYIEDPLVNFLTYRHWFSKTALTEHIREELTGVKNIIESKRYDPEDMEYLWGDIQETTRLIYSDETGKPVKHYQGRQT